MLTKETIRDSINICKLVLKHNLDKAKIDKTHNKTHWENYHNFIVPAVEEFKSRYNNLTPTKMLARFLQDYIKQQNLAEEFSSGAFSITGRLINAYFWACIYKNHSKSSNYKYSPQLYILINRHGIKFGFDYGDDTKPQDSVVQIVLSDSELQEKIVEVLQKSPDLNIYSDMKAGELPESQRELIMSDRLKIKDFWDERTHIVNFYSEPNLPENIENKIQENFDTLLDLFKKTSLVGSDKPDTEFKIQSSSNPFLVLLRKFYQKHRTRCIANNLCSYTSK